MKLIAAFCGLLLVALAAQAQPFPSKAVRLVVPFSAGGSTDIISRTLGQKLNRCKLKRIERCWKKPTTQFIRF